MSNYTRWQMLNESLGFPLGVKSAASLGIAGGFGGLEEGKKGKKKMGEDMPVDDIEVDVEDDDDDEEDAEDKGSEMGDKGGCSCDKAEPKLDAPMMCKKCGKGMKKGMSKKSMKESMFDSYENGVLFKQQPEIGSNEYRNDFLRSLEGHFGNPNQRNFGGVNLGEEVIFEPQDDQMPVAPQPGQPGFAPTDRVGATGAERVSPAGWEQQWMQVTEAVNRLAEKLNR